MSTPRLTLALAFALGCTPENEDEDAVQAGVYIDLEIDAGLKPCGDLVGHMDRFIELVAGVLEVDLADRRYGYRWLTPESYLDSGCSDGSLGCAIDDTAVALSAPLDHELVHVVSFAVGRPPSFFTEGLAVVFGLPESPLGDGSPGADALRNLVAIDRTPPQNYILAGAYTRLLIDRFGMPAYLEFYASLERHADLDAIAAAHEEAFAEPLDATIAVFDAERRNCDYDRFRSKLFECAAPRLPWEGSTLTLRRGISCADDDVVGPFTFGAQAITYATLEISAPGLYELSAISVGGGTTITLGSCGGCESPAPLEVNVGAGPRRVDLDAGTYYVELSTRTSAESVITLQLRRVAD